MKHIVMCSDGTGNSAVKGRGTNVFKVYEAVDVNGHKNNAQLTRQIAFYDDGVGTESWKPIKLLGGAFGWGLSRNVKQLYTELVRVYDPGDKIFLFGFSRGAFTVRTLAGFILRRGLLDRHAYGDDIGLRKAVREAYSDYRKHYRTWFGRKLRSSKIEYRARLKVVAEPRIEFIGVWDTVDAVGVPWDWLADFINTTIYRFKFPDNTLSDRVASACHAIAVDDERKTFHPVMWDETKHAERIEQVWFAGVHSNVGGGYPKQGMSLVTLDWMMEKAGNRGLRFIPEERRLYGSLRDVHDKLYDSRAGLASYYRYGLRDVAMQSLKAKIRIPKIHASVLERTACGTDGYAPVNLPGIFEVASEHAWPAAPQNIAALVGQWIAANNPCDKTRTWRRMREWFHSLFAITTIVGIVLIVWRETRGRSWIETFGRVFSFDIWTILWSGLWPIPWPLVLALIFYLFGLFAKSRMTKIASQFWYGKRDQLRTHL